jgi:hypothetical protein
MDMEEREGKEKSEDSRHTAEEERRCVLVSACIGPLAAERPELVTILDMIRARGGMEGRPPSSASVKSWAWHQHPAEEESKCVLLSLRIGSLAAERPETFMTADKVWE